MKNSVFTIVLFCCASAVHGQTWVTQTSGLNVHLNSVHAVSATQAFVVGDDGKGLKTVNAGVAWNNMDMDVNTDLNSVQFIDAMLGYAYGEAQEVLVTNNGGSMWLEESFGSTTLNDGYYTGGQGWVVGDLEVGYGFLYNPATFNLQQPPATSGNRLNGVHFANNTTGWVVGDNGVILKTSNFGGSWTEQTSGTTETLHDVKFISATTGLAVGRHGTILKTTNGGSDWNVITAPTGEHLNDVYWANASNAWAVGDNSTILRSDNAGDTWTPEPPPTGVIVNFNGVHGSGTGAVWAVGDNGVIAFRGSAPTGILQNEVVDCRFYPNPMRHHGTLNIQSKFNGETMLLEVFNSLGQLVLQTEKAALSRIEINETNLVPGMYHAKLSIDAKQVWSGRIAVE